MKKLLLPLLLTVFVNAKATTWNVSVENFQIVPSTLNVKVGDIIHWVWVNGTHTTSSLTVPAGASAWNSPMTNSSPTFNYTVTRSGTYTYQCNIHPSVMQASFTASAVLPVTLSSFSITPLNGKPVLRWSTSSEDNTDHFSIRKSINGIDLKEIAQVPAAGNSSIKRNYSFTDDNITNSVQYVYYALGIVNKDGKTQLFPIKVYKNGEASVKLITSISPNPVSGMGHVMIQFNANKPGMMNVRVSDMQGRILLQTQLTAVQGLNNGHIHLGDMPAGMYIIDFSLDGVKESYKITKE